VVNEKTGKPIGFGLSVVRQIAHAAAASICYIVSSRGCAASDNRRQIFRCRRGGTHTLEICIGVGSDQGRNQYRRLCVGSTLNIAAC
jgi:hypothetical protein